MIPSEDGKNYVFIVGCPNGIDWSIKHIADEVIFESEKGSIGKLPLEDYKNMVLKFTNEIENFYGDPNDKIVPEEDLDKNAFNQFWKEWKELKSKCK